VHIELVEVVDHPGVGERVLGAELLDDRRVAGTQPEEEPAGVGDLERGGAVGRLRGVGVPDGQDAAGHRDVLGSVEQPSEPAGEAEVEATGAPQGPVAERFHLGSRCTVGPVGAGPRAAPPDPDLAKFHQPTLAIDLRRAQGAGGGRSPQFSTTSPKASQHSDGRPASMIRRARAHKESDGPRTTG
jgi:hypothetical protein